MLSLERSLHDLASGILLFAESTKALSVLSCQCQRPNDSPHTEGEALALISVVVSRRGFQPVRPDEESE